MKLRDTVETVEMPDHWIAGIPAPAVRITSQTVCSFVKSSVLNLSLAFIIALIAFSSAFGTIRLPALISDNMVVQQGKSVAIWGNADPDEQVTVTFSGEQAISRADNKGQWKVHLDPFKAGGPSDMIISGKNMITLHNVMVGEVWICSGQ